MILKGTVKSGLGEAKNWIKKAEEILQSKTKMKMFHGTLNVILNKEYKIKNNKASINADEYGGTENLYLDECKVFGYKAYILRTEKNEGGNGDHPLNIIEIISNINLRETYNLKDGDEIQIEI